MKNHLFCRGGKGRSGKGRRGLPRGGKSEGSCAPGSRVGSSRKNTPQNTHNTVPAISSFSRTLDEKTKHTDLYSQGSSLGRTLPEMPLNVDRRKKKYARGRSPSPVAREGRGQHYRRSVMLIQTRARCSKGGRSQEKGTRHRRVSSSPVPSTHRDQGKRRKKTRIPS